MRNVCAVCGIVLRKGDPIRASGHFLVHAECAQQPRELWRALQAERDLRADLARAQSTIETLRRQLEHELREGASLGRRVSNLEDARERAESQARAWRSSSTSYEQRLDRAERELAAERAAAAARAASPVTPVVASSDVASRVVSEPQDDAEVRYSLLELDLEERTGGDR